MEKLKALLQQEYDRCIHLSQHPKEGEELFGISQDEMSDYYSHRAEGLGFAIDRISMIERGAL